MDRRRIEAERTTEIVTLTEQDLPALAGLYRQFGGERSALEDMRRVFHRLENNPGYRLLGAKRGKQLVGTVMGVICEELYGRCRPFMVVEDMIVDGAGRRQGAGTLLMRAIEQEAVRRDCSYIMLVTDSFRTEALAFYRSLGYDPSRYRGLKKYLESPAGGPQA
jgi:ribosomal protein S18 acetylase RimI-like enzyme